METRCPQGPYTGVAWLSSACVVRCWVKSRNERNPCPMLPAGFKPGTQETAGVNSRKVGTTSSHHGPYVLGCKHATMAGTEAAKLREGGANPKSRSQFGSGLQLDPVKSESLVIANQQRRRNTFLGLVHTARHVTKVGNTRSQWPNPWGGSCRRCGIGDWDEVVTR